MRRLVEPAKKGRSFFVKTELRRAEEKIAKLGGPPWRRRFEAKLPKPEELSGHPATRGGDWRPALVLGLLRLYHVRSPRLGP